MPVTLNANGISFGDGNSLTTKPAEPELFNSISAFNGSGNFATPNVANEAYGVVVGGGGGSNVGNNGGPGGLSAGIVNVTAGTPYSVTVGGGGPGNHNPSAAGTGGQSVFRTLIGNGGQGARGPSGGSGAAGNGSGGVLSGNHGQYGSSIATASMSLSSNQFGTYISEQNNNSSGAQGSARNDVAARHGKAGVVGIMYNS